MTEQKNGDAEDIGEGEQTGGVGSEGTIPDSENGIALTVGDGASHFNEEEDDPDGSKDSTAG